MALKHYCIGDVNFKFKNNKPNPDWTDHSVELQETLDQSEVFVQIMNGKLGVSRVRIKKTELLEALQYLN